MDNHSPDYQAVIDQALDLVFSHHHRLVKQLAPDTFVDLSIDDLRAGPIGSDRPGGQGPGRAAPPGPGG